MTDKKPANNEEKEIVKEVRKEKIAIVRGRDLKISMRNSVDICKMIRGKDIENALKMLDEVLRFRRAVRMNAREAAHKPGRGVMAGRYPIKACTEFARLLKQLKANAMANEIETSGKIIFCKADVASRPYRRTGQRFKRAHVLIKLEPKAGRK